MKKNLNVKDGLVRIEKAILECGDIKATKVAVGLSYNLAEMRDKLQHARENLKNTPAMDEFNRAVQDLREKNATKTNEEQLEAFAELKKKHKQAQDDAEDLRKRDIEAGEMNFDVDLYRISLTHIPGWFGDDVDDSNEIDQKNKAGVIPFSSLQVLVEFGILYDPAIENADGSKVEEPEKKV